MEKTNLFICGDDKKRGLYIHIPFCKCKCAYCDFYSFCGDEKTKEDYTNALIREIEKYKGFSIDTLYLGGGTPTLLGEKNLEKLLFKIKSHFGFISEAAMEANPGDNLEDILKIAKQGGINRLSLGVQSAIPTELDILGRRHSNLDVINAVKTAKNLGIDNISLDLMIGIPEQTKETLKDSIEFLTSLNPNHISCYMLSLEEGTPLYKVQDKYNIPRDDEASALWIYASEILESKGYMQYEISNFAKVGYESKHNLKYWNDEEYIGICAAAHGFINGKRYSYENDAKKFTQNPKISIYDIGGSAEEYLIMKLRLIYGINYNEFQKTFGEDAIPLISAMKNLGKKLEIEGYVKTNEENFSLTKKGFLVFNSILSEILKDI